MSLKQKVFSGIFWNFIETFLLKGVVFFAMIFIARYLGPEEFGLIGMIAVFIAIGNSLVDSGLSSSLIRTKGADDSDFSTVFYMNMLMSILVYVVLYVSAPSIALFFEQEVLKNIIRVFCLTFVVSAFSAVQLAILNKEMKFRRVTLLSIPSTVIGAVIGLWMSSNNYGVWSIVSMYMSTNILLSLLLWLTSNWKPSFRFSMEKLRFHYAFGYKLMLSGLLNRLFDNSFNIVIGKFYPVEMLGFYDRAKKFNDYPSMAVTSVIGKVTYPVLSRLQDNREKLSFIYRKMLRVTFFIIAPLMIGAAAVAWPLFDLLLGKAWVAAVPFFQILSISAILYPIHAFNITILKVFGRSDLFLKLEIIKKIILVIALFIGFQFGIFGLVWSSVVTSIFALLVNTHYSSRFIDYKTGSQLLDMLPILILCGVMFVIINYCSAFFIEYSSMLQIVFSFSIGFVFYISINLFLPKSAIHELLLILKK
jgi:O-antigen/teichoic acid export membrane protein